MKLPILTLAAAGFAVVTTEFVIIGVLPQLAADLGVTIAQAGLLATIFAFTVAIAAPFLTALVAQFERKKLFATLLAMIAVSNVLTAFAPTFETLAAARVIGALALPVFWAVGTASAAQLGGPEGGGKSVAILYASISAGTVIGIPLGTLLADLMGWRVMFGAIGALSAIMSLALLAFFPTTKQQAAPSLLKQASILKRPMFLGHLVLTAFAFTSMFVAYTYLADILQTLASVPASQVAWVLMGFGVVGLFGNWLAGQYVDRSPMGVTAVSLAALALSSFATVALTGQGILFLIPLAIWGAAQSAGFIGNQLRVMKQAPEAQEFASALSVTIAQVGIGLGALIGGLVIDAQGLAALGSANAMIGFAGLVVAAIIALGIRASRTIAVPAE
ncbi:MFS transporter [Roseobacter sp. YSTF-M11]|uniref:MFS transporter n=1 Tax=Roseobacter insulae TaxID=2859783 RepID=A0A9X1FT23_9RHOB|nr:MFS transporter [Roseobacter insulae]MBW4706388.1 MFS transporter [Roseobacter insulae]